MSKNKKVVFLLIMAIIFSMAASFGVYKYCESQKGIVYIFNANYSAGEKINKEMFTGIKVDEQIINAGKSGTIASYYITGEDFEKVINANEYLLNDVSKGEAFVFTDLAVTSGNAIERKLTNGEVAVTIPISGVALVTDDLRVGSTVNVYITNSTSTELVFENMKIAALTKKNGNISNVTFLLSENDATQMIHIANNNTLYFGLVLPNSAE